MQSRSTQSRKGSPEGRRPFGGVKGRSPLGSPINMRALYAVALNSIAKRESRGSKTLWQGQGADLDYHIKCNTAPKKERHCVRFVLE